MGRVYRARDPRLDRDVAIKVITPELAGDAAVLARFEREAMSVAKLSHANILAIHEFGRDAGTAFVVTELVDGETLRARLAQGPLPARRAVASALQIARGIAAAHARGIAHRDLKPENVMITRDDQVKILDFGLAKPLDIGGGDMTQGVGLTTNTGFVLGTFGYMAPEQVRGLAVDHRADIFAFGAVLYEMLTGARAFRGETAADTMTAILTKDPPELDSTRSSIPAGLERIVHRCLEKSPDQRFQSATDLAFALETLSTVSTSSSAAGDVPPQSKALTRRPAMPWLSWSIAAVAIVAAAASWLRTPAAITPETRWSTFTRISEAAGEETSPTLSPDGGTVAYAAAAKGGWDIYSQRVGGRNATAIVNDPARDERGPAFSPDGSLLAFHEGDDVGGVFLAGATGESVRRLTDLGFEPAWSPDGKQIAFATEEVINPASRQGVSTLYVVDAAGGSARKVVDGDGVQPSWSPAGNRIVYWSNSSGQRDIYTVAAAGGARVVVTEDAAIDWSPVWSPDGRFIYFSSDRGGAMNLWRIAVDQESGRPRGAPEPVTAGVQASAALPKFSRDGSRLAFRSRSASINPVAIPFDPVSLRAGAPTVLDTRNSIRIPSDVSPDGRQIAYFSLGESQEDIFIGAPDGSMRRVTDDAGRDRAPMFTPDGRSLVFYSNRDGNWAVWMVATDGANLRKVVGMPSGATYPQISPRGEAIAFTPSSGMTVTMWLALAAPPGTAPTELPGTLAEGRYLNATSWSPDANRLAGYIMGATGRPSGVGVYELSTRAMSIVSSEPTDAAKWLADSRRLIYFTRSGSELVVLDSMTRKRTLVDVHLPAPSTNDVFAISHDNRTIYYGAARAESDIWIVERK
jgi:Tol biopolymer transport system component/serine/threonine protein kinase